MLTDREAGAFIIATPVAWALGTWLWPEHTSLPGVLFGALALGWLWSQRPRSSAS